MKQKNKAQVSHNACCVKSALFPYLAQKGDEHYIKNHRIWAVYSPFDDALLFTHVFRSACVNWIKEQEFYERDFIHARRYVVVRFDPVIL